jgi:hypothetical protein
MIVEYREVDGTGVPTGRIIKCFEPFFCPLSYSDLRSINLEKKISIPLLFKSNGAEIADLSGSKKIASACEVTTFVDYEYECKTMGLVSGGWLPAGIAASANDYILYFDRCTVSEIKGRFDHGVIKKRKTKDLIELLEGVRIKISPLLYALEGNLRRDHAHENSVIQQLHEATKFISDALPLAEVIEHKSDEVMNLINFFRAEMTRHETFLMRLAKELSPPASSKRKAGLLSLINEAAESCGVENNSLVYLAVLSALYSPPKQNPAKRLFKFSQEYNEADAYNALADLRSLKILIMLYCLNPDKKHMLCTGDKNLALFWSGLNVHDYGFFDGKIKYVISPIESLMPNYERLKKFS